MLDIIEQFQKDATLLKRNVDSVEELKRWLEGNKRAKEYDYDKLEAIKLNDFYIIEGRRWFDKVNGNTYHSVKVFKNNEVIGDVSFEYGYDDAYVQTAYVLLSKNDDNFKDMDHYEIETIFRNNRDKLYRTVSDVQRKKDL